MADAGHIEQAIMNLALNARDAMPEGGKLTLETRNAMIGAEYVWQYPRALPGEFVVLSVCDTGMGMSDEVRTHLFEPFYTTKKKGQGTGLGLLTVYGIMQQFGGFIEVDAALGRGTEFRLFFPRAEQAPRQVFSQEPEEPRGGTETLLVVEDEEAVRRLTVRMLEAVGYTVYEAANGEEGLRVTESLSGRVEIVLSDIVMPQMTGPEMVRRLHGFFPNVKAVYMSGFTERPVTDIESGQGRTKVLLKPFTRKALLKHVRNGLDKA